MDDKIRQFCDITQQDERTARDYIERGGGNLMTAINIFYDDSANDSAPMQRKPEQGAHPAPQKPPQARQSNGSWGSQSRGRVSGMGSIRSNDEGDKDTNYFTGTNERGAGVYVRGASKDARTGRDDESSESAKSLVLASYMNGILVNPDTDARWFPKGTPEYDTLNEAVESAKNGQEGTIPRCVRDIAPIGSDGTVALSYRSYVDKTWQPPFKPFEGKSHQLGEGPSHSRPYGPGLNASSDAPKKRRGSPLRSLDEPGAGRIQVRYPNGNKVVLNAAPSHSTAELADAIVYESNGEIDPKSFNLIVRRPGQAPERLDLKRKNVGELDIIGRVLIVDVK